ncbi:hypothetical protein ROZALSC1DRAFT_22270 [Rozella allomycis CSF55]|uniref:WD40 repeat-like protein n=1 Tax=Rozella allomycis (strain CSF55) TaxID=988480 RepID=A0A4V1IZW3_ROZAC|nr:hypothetical protein ROZALSC1DRAFT_22270 [Rozella allomycis CSF55]
MSLTLWRIREVAHDHTIFQGLCAVSPTNDSAILAFPSSSPGIIQLIDLNNPKATPCLIKAHESRLAALAISSDGKKIATASEKSFQREYILNFDSNGERIVVSSDKETIHIFHLNPELKDFRQRPGSSDKRKS